MIEQLEKLGAVDEETTFSRRSFLKGSGMLVVGFSIAGSALAAAKATAAGEAAAGFATPDASLIDTWIAVHADNTVSIAHGKVELGQGAPTGLIQIAAEELDVGMDQVRQVRIDTTKTPDQGFTAGSSSISRGGIQVRQAAAEARQALLALAATALGVPAAQLTVDRGVVSGGGKKVTYGELIGDKRFDLKITGKAPVKKVSDYKLVGTRQARLDIPDKVSGSYVYMQHVRVPGMLHGRIVRPKGQAAYGEGAKPLSVDESSIRKIPGARVVRKGDFVGVVAPNEYAAIQAAAQLKVTWAPTSKLPSSGNLPQALRAAKTDDRVAESAGDLATGFAKAVKTSQASFANAYQAHAMIGPSCAIADVHSDSATVICATQLPGSVRNAVAGTLGLKNDQVRLVRYEGSGCYGHSCYDDAAHAAAVMSQAVGKPVRVQFMRWDEHGWDNYGPAQVTDVRAGIDADNKLVAYEYTSWQQGWMSVETSQELVGTKVPAAVGRADVDNSGQQYAIPHKRVVGKSVSQFDGFLKGVWLRAPGAPQALFASEQVIDDLAYQAGLDPIAFRSLNAKDERWVAVMQAAAKAAKWRQRRAASSVSKDAVVRGRGIAIGGFAGTFAAVIAEIELNRKTGKIVAKHLYAAQDAGLTINPALVEQQIEGCLVQGASRALLEEIKFSKSRVTSLDWDSYPILRFKDAPNVTPIVVQRTDKPSSGSGEPTTAPVAAAIANAFFDATGKRIHEYPMTPGRVRAVLKA